MTKHHTPRGEMTPEERERVQKQERRRNYFQAKGQPLRIRPDEMNRLLAHLRRLRNAGMSFGRIAELGGLNRTAVADAVNGRSKTVTRETYNKLMTVSPEPVGVDRGPLVPAVGTVRRLQALAAIGWGSGAVGERIGLDPANVGRIRLGRQPTVYAATAAAVTSTYAKLSCETPSAEGGRFRPELLRGTARRNRWAPPGCWDWDTIDDPDAIPEWTGACGTVAGPLIHRRERIPVCDACKADELQPAPNARTLRFNYLMMRKLCEEKHITRRMLARDLNVSLDAVYRWWHGDRNPRDTVLPYLAARLGVTLHDLELPNADENE